VREKGKELVILLLQEQHSTDRDLKFGGFFSPLFLGHMVKAINSKFLDVSMNHLVRVRQNEAGSAT